MKHSGPLRLPRPGATPCRVALRCLSPYPLTQGSVPWETCGPEASGAVHGFHTGTTWGPCGYPGPTQNHAGPPTGARTSVPPARVDTLGPLNPRLRPAPGCRRMPGHHAVTGGHCHSTTLQWHSPLIGGRSSIQQTRDQTLAKRPAEDRAFRHFTPRAKRPPKTMVERNA